MKNILYILYLIYREQIACSKMHKNSNIQLYEHTFARRMNCVEIDREGRDLYLLRKWFSATTSAKSEISSVIRGRLNYTVKGAVDLNHLHGDIFFDGTVSRPPANLCSRILAANLIRATIRIDECCWT